MGNIFTATGSVSVMFNTTLKTKVFQIPDSFLPLLRPGDPTTITIFKSAPGIDGQPNPNAPASGEVYAKVVVQAHLLIGGVFALDGYLGITAAVSPDGYAYIRVDGAVGTTIPILGSLAGIINLTVYAGTRTGVVGRVQLLLGSSNIPGITLSGQVMLEINTFSSQQVIQTFKVKTKTFSPPTGGTTQIFDGFEHDAAGNLISTTATITTVGGFRLVLGGLLVIGDRPDSALTIAGQVEFRLELAGANPAIELIVNGTMELAPIGGVYIVDSGFRIDSQGLVARVDVQIGLDFGTSVGLAFSGSVKLELNTTGRTQTLGSTAVAPGFLLRIEGCVDFLGFVTGNGFLEVRVASSGFQLIFRIAFDLGGLQFRADGGAAIVSDGFAMRLSVRQRRRAGLHISASGTLAINTSGRTARRGGSAHVPPRRDRQGQHPQGVQLRRWDADHRQRQRMGVRRERHARLLRLRRSEWDHPPGLGRQLRPQRRRLHPARLRLLRAARRLLVRTSPRVSAPHLDCGVPPKTGTPNSGAGTYVFSLGGSASVKVRVFGITLLGVGPAFNFGLDTSYAGDDGRVKIELSVTVKIHLLFVTVSKTARFTIGYLQFPKPTYLAGNGTGDLRGWSELGHHAAPQRRWVERQRTATEHRDRRRRSEQFVIEQVGR